MATEHRRAARRPGNRHSLIINDQMWRRLKELERKHKGLSSAKWAKSVIDDALVAEGL